MKRLIVEAFRAVNQKRKKKRKKGKKQEAISVLPREMGFARIAMMGRPRRLPLRTRTAPSGTQARRPMAAPSCGWTTTFR